MQLTKALVFAATLATGVFAAPAPDPEPIVLPSRWKSYTSARAATRTVAPPPPPAPTTAQPYNLAAAENCWFQCTVDCGRFTNKCTPLCVNDCMWRWCPQYPARWYCF
ncbi:hypothetical protein VTJ49DRAFT_5496 [Mycothermus thermophilus]|uniref:Uncharacterized protein n=1 Tax=Humicola insolens TaxID=85995 RepID=A0ABR3VLR4_HUMIN